ncbi:MAG: hypothetical protein JNL01_10235 [Bdellovibrionales bacterium]|nr:hypothetical protein [Bdellovibrionales bacterium]
MSANLAELRLRALSLDDRERHTVIEEIANSDHPDTPRELIALYEESEWRLTRIEILAHLSKFPQNSRVTDFLLEKALWGEDLGLQEAAILNLGSHRTPATVTFLRNLYRHGNDILKAPAAIALGRLADTGFASILIHDLKQALEKEDIRLAKALISSLSDLRSAQAGALVLPLVTDADWGRRFPSLKLQAWIALGKILRSTQGLGQRAGFHQDLADSIIESQIASASLSQIENRSQWRLEDYLGRYFSEKQKPHPHLPVEFNSFAAEDVEVGIQLFLKNENLGRLAQALEYVSVIRPQARIALMDAVLAESTPETANACLRSLLFQSDPKLNPWMVSNQSKLPQGEVFLAGLILGIESDTGVWVKKFSESLEPEALAHGICDWLISQRPDPKAWEKAQNWAASWLESKPNARISARVIRTLGRLRCQNNKVVSFLFTPHTADETFSARLFFVEKSPIQKAADWMSGLKAADLKNFQIQALKSLVSVKKAKLAFKGDWSFLFQNLSAATVAPELALGILDFSLVEPSPGLEKFCIEALSSKDSRVAIHAIISMQSYTNDKNIEVLAPFLSSKVSSFSGRAVDSLCRIATLRATRVLIDHLATRPLQSELISKLSRSIAPTGELTPYFQGKIDEIMKAHPEHPDWEMLGTLRDKLRPAAPTTPSGPGGVKPMASHEVDEEIRKSIPEFDRLEDPVRAAIRSAEMPFFRPELFAESVDKASVVLEYCKALDLCLEKVIGRQQLFPKIERSLQDFQSVIYSVGLDDELGSASETMKTLSLTKGFTPESFPHHKMKMLAQLFLTGKIVHDRFKALDGLRAWAVVLLLFSRKITSKQGREVKAPLNFGNVSDDSIIHAAKRLMALQDIRNPAAHRQTYLQLSGVENVRKESLELIRWVLKLTQTA